MIVFAFVWMLIAALVILGLMGVSMLGFGVFVWMVVNLMLLPIRIVLWILRGILGLL